MNTNKCTQKFVTIFFVTNNHVALHRVSIWRRHLRIEKALKKSKSRARKDHGHVVNWNTFNTISQPVGICQMKRRTFNAFKAIWRLLAVSLPFCIAGTRAAARAHRTVIPVTGKSNELLLYIPTKNFQFLCSMFRSALNFCIQLFTIWVIILYYYYLRSYYSLYGIWTFEF